MAPNTTQLSDFTASFLAKPYLGFNVEEPKLDVKSVSSHSHTGYSTGGYSSVPIYTLPATTFTEHTATFTFSIKDKIKQVIFNAPATIVIWKDGEKTVVKCMDGEEFDPYYGFCAAVCKRLFGGSNAVRKAAGIPKQKRERKEGQTE